MHSVYLCVCLCIFVCLFMYICVRACVLARVRAYIYIYIYIVHPKADGLLFWGVGVDFCYRVLFANI